MTEETTASSSTPDACCAIKCRACCWITCLACTLVLIVIGTGVMAQWTAWARYKKSSADEYSITITTESGVEVQVPPGHYLKEFRVMQRVDVVSNDKRKKTIYFRPRSVTIEKK